MNGSSGSTVLSPKGTADVEARAKALQEALDVARDQLVKQNEVLQQLTAKPLAIVPVVKVPPVEELPTLKVGDKVAARLDIDPDFANKGIGTVREVVNGRAKAVFSDGSSRWFETKDPDDDSQVPGVWVIFDGKLVEVARPVDMNVRVGQLVKVSMKTMAVVDIIGEGTLGEITSVRDVLEPGLVEVDFQGNQRTVFADPEKKISKGDRVVLDQLGLVVVKNLGKGEDRFLKAPVVNVQWEDIGGLVEAKEQMVEAIEWPHKHADLYKHFNKKPIKGVLLWGPPGCGKTLLGKAAATSLARIYKRKGTASGFIYVKAPEILERWVGNSEATVRNLFNTARRHHAEHGYPAVIFIDEAEAILRKRGSGISSDIEATIVPAFLTEMDGMEDSGALVILATNREDILDPAVVRDGRVDRKIEIARPGRAATAEIFGIHLKDVPIGSVDRKLLAEQATEALFDPKYGLYEISVPGERKRVFTLAQVVNGAMCAGIIDQASTLAMKRCFASGKKEDVTLKDITEAVASVHRQNIGLNHDDELRAFVNDWRDKVEIRVERLRNSA